MILESKALDLNISSYSLYIIMRALITSKNIFRFSHQPAAKILVSNSNSIYFNLAFEEYLFQSNNLTSPTLLLYRNSPTIVIGKHQNPWKQCRNQEMKQQGVVLSRRKTGGGAVYQDLGNSCFSFLTPYEKDKQYDYKTVNNEILISAFANLGVPVEVAGRNDLHCKDRKMSGSAYRLNLGGQGGRGKKSLHHGTILFNVDLKALQKYLNPNKKKLQSKGIDSVISRVMNLNDSYPNINHEHYCKQLQKQFTKHYGGQVEREILEQEKLVKQNDVIMKNVQRLKSWDWLYGQCPEFKYTIDNKFEWGMVEITYNVSEGKVKEAKVYSDCLYPDFITLINNTLIGGFKYDKEGLTAFENTLMNAVETVHEKKMSRQLCEWMRSQL